VVLDKVTQTVKADKCHDSGLAESSEKVTVEIEAADSSADADNAVTEAVGCPFTSFRGVDVEVALSDLAVLDTAGDRVDGSRKCSLAFINDSDSPPTESEEPAAPLGPHSDSTVVWLTVSEDPEDIEPQPVDSPSKPTAPPPTESEVPVVAGQSSASPPDPLLATLTIESDESAVAEATLMNSNDTSLKQPMELPSEAAVAPLLTEHEPTECGLALQLFQPTVEPVESTLVVSSEAAPLQGMDPIESEVSADPFNEAAPPLDPPSDTSADPPTESEEPTLTDGSAECGLTNSGEAAPSDSSSENIVARTIESDEPAAPPLDNTAAALTGSEVADGPAECVLANSREFTPPPDSPSAEVL
jgi:hypothetical protein